ncbi:Uncharacterized protein conserved in archaea [Archaeoglobus sulfaticallidus PM70-1]|uniref:Uncharacterized protein conserved in archaea n=1 Tax=Archaeoglobus sulfaticallidus PM70-1 TaxID=387631 RepID=N0BMN2_9EURY|nr:KEOPS complex subunit Pcc1 [Archaeoglobus sulfaticallidus]AGK61886.1 Uncharacterized protein conserved in archaea [Archaeoglobus sulfaticallidus PM70-1]
MNYKGDFEFKIENYKKAELIFNALKVEGGRGIRSEAKIYLKGGSLILKIEAEDLTSFRASLNSWLRLIRICNEILNVIDEVE